MPGLVAALITLVGIALVIWGVLLIIGGSVLAGIIIVVVGLLVAGYLGYNRYYGHHGGPRGPVV